MKTRIAHLSDIHHDLETLEAVLQTEEIVSSDILVITGDIAGKPVKSEEEGLRKEEAVQDRIATAWDSQFRKLDNQTKSKLSVWHKDDYRKWVLQNYPSNPGVQDYFGSMRRMRDIAKSHYAGILALLNPLHAVKLVVPGNWDTEEFLEAFQKYSLHKKQCTVRSLKFFGYGGDTCSYNSFKSRGIGFDEDLMHELLMKTNPDVILTHVPPKKLTDTGNTSGRLLGSGMLRSYIFEAYSQNKAPLLVLSGHSHSFGFEQPVAGTLVSNPGNLGPEMSEPYGTFNIIDLNDRQIASMGTFVMLNRRAEPVTEIAMKKWKARVPKQTVYYYAASGP